MSYGNGGYIFCSGMRLGIMLGLRGDYIELEDELWEQWESFL